VREKFTIAFLNAVVILKSVVQQVEWISLIFLLSIYEEALFLMLFRVLLFVLHVPCIYVCLSETE
jgi:hypothetical protein